MKIQSEDVTIPLTHIKKSKLPATTSIEKWISLNGKSHPVYTAAASRYAYDSEFRKIYLYIKIDDRWYYFTMTISQFFLSEWPI